MEWVFGEAVRGLWSGNRRRTRGDETFQLTKKDPKKIKTPHIESVQRDYSVGRGIDILGGADACK